MNFMNLMMAAVMTPIVLIVFLPIANALFSAMTGLFSTATFMALNVLILMVVFAGMFGILENLNPNEEEVSV